ncbi:MAG TPA: TVP38/TMEM64 family protein [Coriobacteriia bacterium]|nr:TVP38/TMEM64 family protein [Coriobacteriia bacterium]
MKNIQPKTILKIALLAVIAASLAIYFFVPAVNEAINEAVALLASGDTAVIKKFIDSYGVYAAVISFLLMILQSVLAPIPAFLITFANAGLFGWWQGAILSWTSAMAGAALCFYIARILGRDVVAKLTSLRAIREIDVFFGKYGTHAILIARLLPFISFDIVSYAAGLTKMKFRSFIIATGVGQLPATIVYSYVGGMLTGGTQMFVTALLIIFALFTLVYLLRAVYKERVTKKQAVAEVQSVPEEQP